MNDLIKEIELLHTTTSDEEVVSTVTAIENECELSHGSHNQHSSSKDY